MLTTQAARFRRSLVWLRRDLRLADHTALSAALAQSEQVYCAFVFDTDILHAQAARADRRVEFIHQSLRQLNEQLAAHQSVVLVAHGRATDCVPKIAHDLGVDAVYANRDYEPSAQARDQRVAQALAAAGLVYLGFKDQVIYESDEILSAAGKPYVVFTPYKRAWMARLDSAALTAASSRQLLPARIAPVTPEHRRRYALPSLAQLGFDPSGLELLPVLPGEHGAQQTFEDFGSRIGRYHETRDFPGIRGPSYLSVHLRFGTISVRQLARFATQTIANDPAAAEGARVWLSELVWRDFYFQILHHHPHVVDSSFKPEFDRLDWAQRPDLLAAWQEGRTGYPLVDAAMNQLNHSGYMHNRLRMVTASFLTKDLGIHWREGEAYFARQLIDFDLAANNGGWQWAASTGCDAQPWFRIFNPVTQSQRFDPKGQFIRRYLPQLAGLNDRDIHAPWLATKERRLAAGVQLGDNYPAPVVDHASARAATLERFGKLRINASSSSST